jgi:hypothetical protein
MLTSGVVLLHDIAGPHTAACTRTLLQHFNWELFDHSPSDYHLFTYLKNWLGSQAIGFFDTGTYKLIRSYDKCLIPAVTTLRSSLSMYFFVYNNFLFSLLVLSTA